MRHAHPHAPWFRQVLLQGLLKRPWQWLLLLLLGTPFVWAAGVNLNNLVITTVKQLSFAQSKAEIPVGGQFTQTATVRLSPGAVSYGSKDPSVATVDAQTGRVTGVLAGETTIVASQAAAAPYPAASASYTIKVKGQAVSFNPWALAPVAFGSPAFQIAPATSNSQGEISYSVKGSDPSVLSITAQGLVTVKAVGQATIVATQKPFAAFDGGSTEATLTVTPSTARFTWPNQVVSLGSTLTLTPPTDSPSSGAFSYQVVGQAIASVNGNLLTPSAVGTTTLRVTQAKAGNYDQSSLDVSLSVVAGNTTTLGLAGVPPGPAYGDSFAPQTSTNSTAPVQLSSSNTGIAVVDAGGQVRIVGIGTATITASVAATAGFPAAQASATLTSVKADPFLNMNPLSRLVASPAFELPLSTRSSGAITATSSLTSVAQIDPGSPPYRIPRVVPQNSPGSTTLTIQQAEDGFYKAATLTRTLELNGQTPTITWNVPSYIFTDRQAWAATLPAAVSNSPGALSYSLAIPDGGQWASLNGLTLVLGGGTAGRLVLTVNQAAAAGFAATTFSADVTVHPAVPGPSQIATTLTVDTRLPHQLSDGPFRLATASNSAAPILVEVINGPATAVAGPLDNGVPTQLVKPLQPGTVRVRVSQAANATHTAATLEADVLILSELAPIQSFPTVTLVLDDSKTFVPIPGPVSLSAGAYSYTVADTSIAEVSGSRLTLKRAGRTRLTVTQAANAIYRADTASADLVVLLQPADLAFPQVPLPTMSATGLRYFSLLASSKSPEPIQYASSNPAVATIAANGTVTVNGVQGSTSFTATQAASASNWYAAGQASTSLTVQTANDSGLRLSAFSLPLSASNVLAPYQTNDPSRAVVLSLSDPSYASLNGTRLTPLKTGEVLLTVKHPATATLPEASASAFMTITPAVPSLSVAPASIQQVWTGASPPAIALQASPTGTYQVNSSNAAVATVNGLQVTLTGIGEAYLVVTRLGDANGAEASATIPVRVLAQAPSGATLPLLALKDQVLPSNTSSVKLQASSNNSGSPIKYALVSSTPVGIATVSEQGDLRVMGAGTVQVRAAQDAALPNFLAHSVTATVTIANGAPRFEVTYLPSRVKPGEVFQYRYRTNDSNGFFQPQVNPAVLSVLSHTPPSAAGVEGVVSFKVNPQTVAQNAWIGVVYGSGSFPDQWIDTTENWDGSSPMPAPARLLPIDTTGASETNGLHLEGPFVGTFNADPQVPSGIALPWILDRSNQRVGRCLNYVSSNPTVLRFDPSGPLGFLAFHAAGDALVSCQEDPSLSTRVTVLGIDPQFGSFAHYTLSMNSPPTTVTPPLSTNTAGAWTYEVIGNSGVSGGPAISLINGQLRPLTEGQAVIRARQAAAGRYNEKSVDTLVTVSPSLIRDFQNLTVTYGDQDFSLPRPASADTVTPFSYSIDRPAVATVHPATGLVHIVGAGTATVTATQGSQTLQATLTVRKAMPRLSFNLFGPPAFALQGCTFSNLRWPRANVPGYPDNSMENVPGATLSTNSDGQLSYKTDTPDLFWNSPDYAMSTRTSGLGSETVFRAMGPNGALPYRVWVVQAESSNFYSAVSESFVYSLYTTGGAIGPNGDVYACSPQ